MAWLGGASFGDGLLNGLIGAGIGAGTGAVLGGVAQGISASRAGGDFLTGKMPTATAPAPTTATTNTQPSQTGTQTQLSGAEKMTQVRAVGQAGENAVGIDPSIPKTRILSKIGTANYRIPDRLTPNISLEEVKNVSYLDYTDQLKDFVMYSPKNNLQMTVWVRPAGTIYGPATHLSPALQQIHNSGMINILTCKVSQRC
ncbi:MAG: hypothetical protein LBS50_05965 [Prevotellaceae bacterium]|jgi:hypothetical protein|nr:hypothetical protein [Prevotellaceae bacterium]